MTMPSAVAPLTLAEQVRQHTGSHAYTAALQQLEAAPAGALPPGLGGLLRAEVFAGLECYRGAHELATAALAERQLPPLERARALVLIAQVLRRGSPWVDEALERAVEATQLAAKLGAAGREVAVAAQVEAAQLFVRKQCRALAESALAQARQLGADDPRVLAAEGHVLCACDERAAARAKFAVAAAFGGALAGRLGALGLAQVALLAGEFAVAHGHLDALGPLAAQDLAPRRWRVRVLLAEQRFAEAAAELGAIRAASPAADSAPADAFAEATALYRAGQRDAAVAGWRALGAARPADCPWGRRARRDVALLTRPAGPRRRQRLVAFPSVVQLRNHCGPAAVELYLRFCGLSAAQVEVARAVRIGERGTAVHRLRRYLESAGLATRRIAADLPVLRNLLDAGVPVILEEDYSESRHVAVAVGYDDDREVLEVQDPMSHEVRETPYEDLAALRNLSNHGALVAVPADDPARAAALDAAGALECRYIALTDEAFAALEDGQPGDAERLAAAALALRRDHELAWLCHFQLLRAAAASGDAAARARLAPLVVEIVALWPDDEWPQQLLGTVAALEARPRDALQAFERARDRDPADANNWASVAECQQLLGNDEAAVVALEQALRRNPAHRRANESMAWHAQRLGQLNRAWLFNECARELGPGNPFNHGVHAALLSRRGDLPSAVQAYDRALTLAPAHLPYVLERARLLSRLGRVDEATAALRTLAAARPGDRQPRIELASHLYGHGRCDDAIAVCRELLATDPRDAASHSILGAAAVAKGELEAGLAALRTAQDLAPGNAWNHAALGNALVLSGRAVEAVAAYAAAFGLGSRAEHQLGLARALQRAGDLPAAERHACAAGESGALGETDLGQVGAILCAHRGALATHQWFLALGKRLPDQVGLQRAHAFVLTETTWAPGLAAAPLARLAELAPDDPWACTWRGARLMDAALASEAEGEALLRRAIGMAGGVRFPRRVLATRLRQRGRFAEVLATLAPCPADFAAELDRVLALCGLDRVAEARARVDAFAAGSTGSAASLGVLMLRYHLARHAGDLREALQLCEQILRAGGSADDDGRLDPWEVDKFDVLVRLRETERALRFGERQAKDGPSLGLLAGSAFAGGAVELAAELAGRALRVQADAPLALTVHGRLRELAGDVVAAQAAWRQAAEASRGQYGCDELARLGLGAGQVAEAARCAELAVTSAHLRPAPFVVRAQVRLLGGDLPGARADLERAWGVTAPSARPAYADAWGLRALLAGEPAAADALFAAYLASPLVSGLDRARLAGVREAANRACLDPGPSSLTVENPNP